MSTHPWPAKDILWCICGTDVGAVVSLQVAESCSNIIIRSLLRELNALVSRIFYFKVDCVVL